MLGGEPRHGIRRLSGTMHSGSGRLRNRAKCPFFLPDSGRIFKGFRHNGSGSEYYKTIIIHYAGTVKNNWRTWGARR
jgi:hypothetical protein